MAHKKIPISADRYNVIWALFSKDLKPFTTFSAPEGSEQSPSEGQMMTEWGIDGEDFPLIGNDRRWAINHVSKEQSDHRQNFWLCSPIIER